VPAEERKEPGLLDATSLLLEAPIEVIGLLPYSSNHTFLVRLGTGDDEPLAVYKPRRGERPLYDFPEGTLYQREVAAYEVSQALGWDLVPPTVIRTDAPLGVGSLQLFIDHDPEQHYFTLLDENKAFFKRLAVFDIICNNADRKSGHCLMARDGRIWAVDHGLTFNAQPKLRTVIWDFAGGRVPARDRAGAARLAAQVADDTSGALSSLDALLAPAEIEATVERVKLLSQPCYFPSPNSDWSFPWPLV
jgi:uncharacterized repeat protein (TIGR03843 family)